MTQPRSTNPALAGRPPGQQPAAQQQQQQQPPGSAGLLGPNGQPIQPELFPLRLNPEGVTIPTTSYNSAELVHQLGGSYPYQMVITWLEVAQALASRDAAIEWLERRIADLEKGLGKPSITYEAFIDERFAAMQALQNAQPPAGDPPR